MDEHRRVYCAACSALLRICRACDHGQRYCAEPCARLARRAMLRDAGRRYQATPRGRQCHALRQQRYRARRAQNVTHHGSTPSIQPPTLPAVERRPGPTPLFVVPRRPQPISGQMRCDVCGRPCSERVRIRHPWR